MSKKLKAILYAILPAIMIMLCASMITYIFAATKSELRIEGQIGYERPKGTGTEEDPFLIYSIGPNDGTATLGSFNYYAGNNSTSTNYFSSSSPQYYFKQMQNLSGSDFTKTDLLGFYDGNDYSFTVSSGGGALFSSIGTSSVKTAKLYDLNVSNSDCGDDAGVVLSLYGTLDNVHFSGNNTNDRIGVGGLVENSYDGATILNCSNSATIEGGMYNADDYAGGIVGCVQGRTTIEKCHNTGNVSSYTVAGGVVGKALARCLMSNCSNSGEIDSSEYAGGVIGNIQCSDTFIIDYLCNSGSVTSMVCGGIVGSESCDFFEIYSSYNSGYIDGVLVGGGIIGHMCSHYTIQHTYNIGSIDTNIDTAIAGATLGISGVGGIIGCEQYNDFWSMSLENLYLSSCGPTTAVGSINGAIADDNTTERQGAWIKYDWHDMQNDMMINTATGWNIQDNIATATEGFGWALAEIPVNGVVEGRYLLRLWFEDLTILNGITITLNSNGGTLNTINTAYRASGYTIGDTLPTPTRSGYAFNGWYTASSGGTKITASYVFTANTTVYAQWTSTGPIYYTVTFNPNGGTISGYNVETVSGATYGFLLNSSGYYESQNKGVSNSAALCKVTFYATAGSTVVFTVINYAESSYDFGMLGTLDGTAMSTSYSDVSTGVAKSFSGSQSASTQTYSYSISSTGNHYVYVKYRKDSSVDSNNDSFQFKISSGLTTTSSITVSSGGTISSLPTATRSGYTFKGWFTSTSGGTQLTTSTSITSNRTYYAQWTSSSTTYYTVSVAKHSSSPNSGCSYYVYPYGSSGTTTSISVPSGSQVTFKATISSGYIFRGWCTRVVNSYTIVSSSTTFTTTISSETTYYAYWSVSYTVTAAKHSSSPSSGCSYYVYPYDSSGATTSISVPSLSQVTFKATASSGYTFKGWYSSSSSTSSTYRLSTSTTYTCTITSNTTLYAYWTKNTTTYTCWCCGASISTSGLCSTCSSNTCAICGGCFYHGTCGCSSSYGCVCCGSSDLYDEEHCYTCYNSAAHCDICGACLHHPCVHM